MQYSVFLPKVGHEIILKREREIKYVIRQTDKTQITLLKAAYFKETLQLAVPAWN